MRMSPGKPVSPAPDGSFHIGGLSPGVVNIFLNRSNDAPQGFSLLRIENNGAPITEGIPVGPGQQITGVRVVIGYGVGVLRGHVMIQGGTLPEGTPVWITATPTSGDPPIQPHAASLGPRGQFEIDGLMDGQYRLIVSCPDQSIKFSQPEQLVTISGSQPADVNLTVKIGKT